MAIKAGIDTFRSYSPDALVPLDTQLWDSWDARSFRYYHYKLYYHNKIYSSLQKYVEAHLKDVNHGLYRHTRAIYNPVGRLVDLYPAKVYGGQLDYATLSQGAIPITGASDEVLAAIRRIWEWSNWQNHKSTYVRTGAMQGDVFLKVVGEPSKNRVRLAVLNPGLVRDVKFDGVGNVLGCEITYELLDAEDKPFVYREVWEGNLVKAYRDEHDFAAFKDPTTGKPTTFWINPYGFVPLVHMKHLDIGEQYGACAFYKILDKIDEMNAVASRQNDQIAKVVNSIYQAKGSTGKIELQIDDSKDTIPILHVPEGVELEALVNSLDLAATAQTIQEMLREIERDTPELSLHRIRESGADLSGVAVLNAFSDAVDIIKEAAGNYDLALVRAQRMALVVGATLGLEGFESFRTDDWQQDEALRHYIKERPVIQDGLNKIDRVNILVNIQAPEELIYTELGYSEEEVERARKKQEARDKKKTAMDLLMQQRQLALQRIEGDGGASPDDQPEDSPPEPQEAFGDAG